MKKHIKVINQNGLAVYFPSFISYKNIKINTKTKTIDGMSYIEITQDEWENNRSKRMIVKNGEYMEEIKSNNQLLEEAKNAAIHSRETYLKNTGWYYESDTMPEDIKNKRVLTRQEINQIEQETDINKIVIDF